MKKQIEKQAIEEIARTMCRNYMPNGNCAADYEPCGLECVYGYCAERVYCANYSKVIRCKDCEHHHWEQEPCHGKTIHKCSVLNAEVFKDFYCYHGKQKMKGGAE